MSTANTTFTTSTNDPPAFSSATATRSLSENAGPGDNVGAAVRATDSDGDILSYSLSGTDAASFSIDLTSGQITVASGVSFDYETKTVYSVTVTATDAYSGSDSIAVTVNITNVYEGPTLDPNPEAGHRGTGTIAMFEIGGSASGNFVTITETPGTGDLGLSNAPGGLDGTCTQTADTINLLKTATLWVEFCTSGQTTLRVADRLVPSLFQDYTVSIREEEEALPLKETGNPFVDRICWRFPGCPLSVIFSGPLIMVGTVSRLGGRHPALLTLAGAGTFAGLMVLFDPNPFTFVIVGLVAVAVLMLWRLVKL